MCVFVGRASPSARIRSQCVVHSWPSYGMLVQGASNAEYRTRRAGFESGLWCGCEFRVLLPSRCKVFGFMCFAPAAAMNGRLMRASVLVTILRPRRAGLGWGRHSGVVTSFAWSPDSARLITGVADGTSAPWVGHPGVIVG